MTKEFKAGLIVTLIEIALIVLFGIILMLGFQNSSSFADIFASMNIAFIFMIVATIILSILIFSIKSLKTKTTVRWAIWDLIWAAFMIWSLI